MNRPTRPAAALLMLVLPCAAAHAQVRHDTAVRPSGPAPAPTGTLTPAGQPQGLQRVDPGVGDIDPLRASLRDLSVDLRSSGDFSSPYRLPGAEPGTSDDRFVRYGGGTTAVFPRSVYTRTREGVVAEIPPGTVFYIGGVPPPQPWERTLDGTPPRRWLMPPTMSAERADVRLSTAAATAVTGSAAGASEPRLVGARTLLLRAAEISPREPEPAG